MPVGPSLPEPSRLVRPPRWFSLTILVCGLVGLLAAGVLTLERFSSLAHPGQAASCDFGVLVQCSANLASWQGSVFGFPNPLIGLVGWTVPVVVGIVTLGGAGLARWFWIAFGIGMMGAFIFVCWLIGQSIFVLGTLCPWCMVTWAVTIPAVLSTWLFLFASKTVPSPEPIRRAASTLTGWIILITFVAYVVIAVLAQLRLDVVNNL